MRFQADWRAAFLICLAVISILPVAYLGLIAIPAIYLFVGFACTLPCLDLIDSPAQFLKIVVAWLPALCNQRVLAWLNR